MTDHQARIREHYRLEAQALLVAAEQARLFDHNTNRGTEVEKQVLRWLRKRFEPEYTVSSGEIIDSFDTNADRASRQQDGIIHRNDADANRFLLPSGMRLVPIESVAAVVEVKLSLDKREFEKSDLAATETAKLRLRLGGYAQIPKTRCDQRLNHGEFQSPLSEDICSGVPISDARLRANRPMFAVFGLGGVSTPETLASWLFETNTVNLVTCLGAGTACDLLSNGEDRWCSICQAEDALAGLGHFLDRATKAHAGSQRHLQPDFSHYSGTSPISYWNHTHYDDPSRYTPTDEQIAAREELYTRRPELRRQRERG